MKTLELLAVFKCLHDSFLTMQIKKKDKETAYRKGRDKDLFTYPLHPCRSKSSPTIKAKWKEATHLRETAPTPHTEGVHHPPHPVVI